MTYDSLSFDANGHVILQDTLVHAPDSSSSDGSIFTRGLKFYELSNHLGNVLATVSDSKLQVENAGNIDYFTADIRSMTDYYGFGMEMPGRGFDGGDYRFGFQGQEADKELFDGAISYKYRIHDPRIGKFLSRDPLEPEYPWNSPYAFSENRVIDGVELEGLEYADADGNITTYFPKDVIYANPEANADEIEKIESGEWTRVSLELSEGATITAENPISTSVEQGISASKREYANAPAWPLQSMQQSQVANDNYPNSVIKRGIDIGINSHLNSPSVVYSDAWNILTGSSLHYAPIRGAGGIVPDYTFETLFIPIPKGTGLILKGTTSGTLKSTLSFTKVSGTAQKINYYTLAAKNLGYSSKLRGLRIRAPFFVQISHNIGNLANRKGLKILYSNSLATAIGRGWQNQAIGSGLIGISSGIGLTYHNLFRNRDTIAKRYSGLKLQLGY